MTNIDEGDTSALSVPPFQGARFHRMAEIVAILGVILMVLSLALFVYYWERMIQITQHSYPSYEDMNAVHRFGTISNYLSSVSWVLVVTSIALMIRGVQIGGSLASPRERVLDSLVGAKWVTLVALLLYLFSAVLKIVIGETTPDLSDDAELIVSRLMIYTPMVATIFLVTLPVIAARSLRQPLSEARP